MSVQNQKSSKLIFTETTYQQFQGLIFLSQDRKRDFNTKKIRELLAERQRCRKKAIPEEQELPNEDELLDQGKWLTVS